MPFTITGKVTDEYGSPIGHTVVIKEVPPTGANLGSADVWADSNGNFMMLAIHSGSLIEISSHGYEPVFFEVHNVPAVIKLNVAEGLIINGTTTKKKKDNTLWYLLGLAGLAVGYASYKKPAAKATGKTTVATPKKPAAKPIKVVV